MFVMQLSKRKAWAEYLFQGGSMIGLNAQLLGNYIEWIANKRMIAIGLSSPFKTPAASPLPWTQKWISGGDVQVAPQETEIELTLLAEQNKMLTQTPLEDSASNNIQETGY